MQRTVFGFPGNFSEAAFGPTSFDDELVLKILLVLKLALEVNLLGTGPVKTSDLILL